MLQDMFYLLGIVFFAICFANFFVSNKKEIKDYAQKNRLKVDIGFLLLRVPNIEVRNKAAKAFSAAKTTEELSKIKSRLIEILSSANMEK